MPLQYKRAKCQKFDYDGLLNTWLSPKLPHLCFVVTRDGQIIYIGHFPLL